MRFFVYGHTHAFETEWSVRTSQRPVGVLNDGAFQRVIDDESFRAMVGDKNVGKALRDRPLSDLPACYTSVRIFEEPESGLRRAELRAWHLKEDGSGGGFIDVCDVR